MRAPDIRLSDAARKALQEAARAAGFESIHAHSLRHTAASLALTRGASLVDVREMLWHASIVTTSRYLHVPTGERPATALVRVLP